MTNPPQSQPSGRSGRFARIAAASLLLAGGGAFAATHLAGAAGAEGGAASPEEAVGAMFTSLEQNDWIGVLDHVAPGEREVLRDATVDTVAELQRLGVLDGGLDLGDVPGFEIRFENVTYEVEQANPRVLLVAITGGQVTVTADAAQLPLGELLVDLLGAPEEAVEAATFDIADELDGGEAPRVAVIDEGGRYYVSLYYTVAEAIAAEAGYTMPGTPIPAVGAESPEAAARQLLEATLELDLERVIELTPPDEMAALHDYGSILVELAEQEIAASGVRVDLEAMTITLDALEFDAVDVSGGVKLLPTHIAVSMQSDEIDAVATVSKVDDTCVEFDVAAKYGGAFSRAGFDINESGRYCAADINELLDAEGVPVELHDLIERIVGQLGQLGIVAVEVDGAWYVSPARGSSDVFLVLLQAFEQGDLELLIDMFGEFTSEPASVVPPSTDD